MASSERLVGILIVTHSQLGEALLHCAEHILGRSAPNLACLSVSKHEDPLAVVDRARELLARLDAGSGVLVLTDMYGGTPSNIANRLTTPGQVEAVAGVSLPMLMRALTYSRETLESVVSKAITGGWEGVVYMLPETRSTADE